MFWQIVDKVYQQYCFAENSELTKLEDPELRPQDNSDVNCGELSRTDIQAEIDRMLPTK